ncbi:serine hydrolase domain-containing protein [Allomuricauda sp. SCSIO 65647]|uniref:serine hydrolase domain-containing protein n=1 Tax=Allomuricauda sp. SCSIO 65647 TaxID=2908843 RepID=UPI001F3D396A|nr:serine hydrolase [Muricauda sp. SCSIO 65647]UJH68947.1 beta-lactamase family protein [Muricauda sp. SCSIO 65647]
MKNLLFVPILLISWCSFAQENDSLPFAHPSEMGLDSIYIHSKTDAIITNGIKNRAFPGAQVLVAKNGAVIFHKAYGFHTYDSLQPVSLTDVYDLASVTKITAPLPALMKLVDEKKLNLDVPFSTYWRPWRKQKDKRNLTLREILAHQAGLQPYIVFLGKVLKKNGQLKKRFVRHSAHKRFKKQAYDSLYVKNRFEQKMQRIINRSKVSEEKKYRYSGLTFLIFPKLIEQLTGEDYKTYLRKNFYDPMGAKTLCFNPNEKALPNKIVPTEIDTLFRHALTQNWVHDENAALLGGVSGNAGLFASAHDLAKLMLLYQNYGAFNGKRYLSSAVVKEFISVQYPENENRRGLGFDKPLLGNDTLALKDAYPAPMANPESFGHSGFTGTFAWADPKDQLVFIFLSNRVHPFRSHRKLYELNIRTALHQVFHEADIEGK